MINKFSISCDWLQIHVKFPEKIYEIENPYYLFKKQGQSKVFKSIYSINDAITNVKLAVFCTDANEMILARNHAIIKFENQQLYLNDDLKSFVETFLKRLQLKFLSTTRFDIAFDFLNFDRNYYPEKFIKDYLNNLIVKKVERGHKIKSSFGINQRNIFEVGNEKSFIVACQTVSKLSFETITFGNRTSDVRIKMYNKTKELEDNPKPWISKTHENNFGKENEKYVWRLEFSLYGINSMFLDDEKYFSYKKLDRKDKDYNLKRREFIKENKGISSNSLDILDIEKMYGIFQGLFEKYFEFRIKKKHGQRVRDMEIKKLLYFDYPNLKLNKIKFPPIFKDGIRRYKSVVNAIDQFNHEWRNLDENLDYSAKEVITKIVEMHELQQWAKNKNIEFTGDENYKKNLYEFSKIQEDSIKLKLWLQSKELNRQSKIEKKKFDEEEKNRIKNEQEYLKNN